MSRDLARDGRLDRLLGRFGATRPDAEISYRVLHRIGPGYLCPACQTGPDMSVYHSRCACGRPWPQACPTCAEGRIEPSAVLATSGAATWYHVDVCAACQEGRRLAQQRRIWRQVDIPARIVAAVCAYERHPHRAVLEEALCRWREARYRSWLWVWGPPRRGKSTAVADSLTAAIMRGEIADAAWVDEGELALSNLAADAARGTEGAAEAFGRYRDCCVLVIDEFLSEGPQRLRTQSGQIKRTAFAVGDLLKRRYDRGLGTVLVSNRGPDNNGRIFSDAFGQTLGRRLFERLYPTMEVVSLQGPAIAEATV